MGIISQGDSWMFHAVLACKGAACDLLSNEPFPYTLATCSWLCPASRRESWGWMAWFTGDGSSNCACASFCLHVRCFPGGGAHRGVGHSRGLDLWPCSHLSLVALWHVEQWRRGLYSTFPYLGLFVATTWAINMVFPDWPHVWMFLQWWDSECKQQFARQQAWPQHTRLNVVNVVLCAGPPPGCLWL